MSNKGSNKRRRSIAFKGGRVFDNNELEMVQQLRNPSLPSAPASASWTLRDTPLPSQRSYSSNIDLWGSLLPELILVIFDELDALEAFTLSSTCKHWRLCFYSSLKALEIDGSERGRGFKDTNLRDISSLSALHSLSLVSCRFVTQQAFVYLLPLPNLRSLSLIDCPQVALVYYPSLLSPFFPSNLDFRLSGVSFLAKFLNLEHLELDGAMTNTMDSLGRLLEAQSSDTDGALKFLCDPSTSNLPKSLTSLSLRKWHLGKSGIDSLCTLPLVHSLDLTEWKLQISAALALKGLQKLSNRLRSLTLASCGLNSKLVESLAAFDSLNYLKLTRNIKSIATRDAIMAALRKGRAETELRDDFPSESLVVVCDGNEDLFD